MIKSTDVVAPRSELLGRARLRAGGPLSELLERAEALLADAFSLSTEPFPPTSVLLPST